MASAHSSTNSPSSFCLGDSMSMDVPVSPALNLDSKTASPSLLASSSSAGSNLRSSASVSSAAGTPHHCRPVYWRPSLVKLSPMADARKRSLMSPPSSLNRDQMTIVEHLLAR